MVMTHDPDTTAGPAPRDRAGWVLRHAPAIILCYLGLHFVLRTLIPGGMSWDEAEQLVVTQDLALGYGQQPPLYNWIQWAVFAVTGPGMVGMALVKHVTLTLIYLGLWVLARQLGAPRQVAGIALLGGLLMPTLYWEAHRDLTHLTLVTAASVWTPVAVIAAIRSPRPFTFALVGLVFAAGFLAKWNYPLVIAGLSAALLVEPRARTRLWFVTGGVMLTPIILPTIWVIRNWALTVADRGSFEIERGPLLPLMGRSAAAVVEAYALETALVVLVMLAVFRIGARRAGADAAAFTADRRLVERTMLFGFVLTLALTVAAGATEVINRWLLPLTIFAPAVLALRLAPWMTAPRRTGFVALSAGLMLLMLVFYPMHLVKGGDNPSTQSAPFAAVPAAVGIGAGDMVYASDVLIGGNLRLAEPGLAVVTPKTPTVDSGQAPDVVVWWGRDRPDAPAPADLRALLAAKGYGALDLSAPRTAAVPYPAPHADRRLHLFWVEVPG